MGDDLSEAEIQECQNVTKSFLENYYNRRIRDKHLKRYLQKYELECIEKKKNAKKLTDKVNKLFIQLNTAILLKQEYILGKLHSIPKWAESFFTKDTLFKFMKSLPREVQMPEFETAELLINFIYYCIGLGVSWSHYLLMFKDGRQTLKNVFFSGDYNSVLALAKVIYIVGVTKAYDDILFRQEFYTSFPNIEQYVIGDPSGGLVNNIYHKAALFAIGEISFAVFKKTLDSAVIQIQRLRASNNE